MQTMLNGQQQYTLTTRAGNNMARPNNINMAPGGGGGAAKGPGAVSVRPSTVDQATKNAVRKQNKAADTYKIKDLDAMDKNKAAYERAKELAAEKAASAKNEAYKSGAKTGAAIGGLAAIAATVAAEKARLELQKKKEAEAKAKGTQAGHTVTDSKNHTRTVK